MDSDKEEIEIVHNYYNFTVIIAILKIIST